MIMSFIIRLVHDHVVYNLFGSWLCRSYFNWFMNVSFIFQLVHECVVHTSIGLSSCHLYLNWFMIMSFIFQLFMMVSLIFLLVHDDVIYFDWFMILTFIFWLVHIVFRLVYDGVVRVIDKILSRKMSGTCQKKVYLFRLIFSPYKSIALMLNSPKFPIN